MHETIRKAYLSLLPLPPLCVCVRERDRDRVQCGERERDRERERERERDSVFGVCVRLLYNSPESAIVEFTHSHPLSST